MEGDVLEQDFHEIEMLLGEIPKAISESHLRRQISLSDSSQMLDTASTGQEKEFSPKIKSAELYNFHRTSTNEGSDSCIDAAFSKIPEYLKLQSMVHSGYEFPEEIHMENNSNMQDEESLALLLEETSIKECLASKPISPASVMNKKSHLNYTRLLNEQCMNHHNKFFIGYGPVGMNLPQSGSLNGVNLSSIEVEPQCPIMERTKLAIPSDRIDAHCNVGLFKSDDNYEPKQISDSLLGSVSDHQEVFPVSTMATPVNSCFNTCQLAQNAHEMQLPNTYHPNYYVDIQSRSRHITHSGMVWRGMEEQRYCRRYQQQYLYAQHLQSQRSESIQFQKSIDCGVVAVNGNSVQPCLEFPIPQQFEHCKNPYLNANAFYDKSNILGYCQYPPQGSSAKLENFLASHEQKVLSANGLSNSANDFQGHQVFDKVGKRCFPEKILTRSHGVNSVRVLRTNPFTTDQTLLFDKNSLWWSKHNVHQPRDLNNGSLQFNKSNKGLCPNVFCPGLVSKSIQKRYSSVDEVLGRICLLAKDQHGCRFLQRKFAEGSREDINKIFSEIILHIVELMTDPFGNYLVQKLLEVCSEGQMMLILKVMTRNVNELIRISCDMHGTRAVQKVIETVRTPEQISIVVSSLEPCIISIMKHINGNHVAQRCLQCLSKHSELLVEAAIAHCVELATDRQGCCVLQRCLLHAEHNQKQMLIAEISAYSLILSKDPFGNYVVQFVLDLNDPWANALVLEHLLGNYDHLSVQKHSSNVVERCMNLAGEADLVKIIRELLTSPLLSQIMQDPFGNYVVQTALNVSKVHEGLHAELLDAVVSHSSTLRSSSPYGKKVLSAALLHLNK